MNCDAACCTKLAGHQTVLIDATNLDHEAAVTENAWVEYSGALSGFTDVSMRFGLESSHAAEEAWFDHFRIVGSGPDRSAMLCDGSACAAGTEHQ